MSNEMTLSPDLVFLQNKNAARITGWLGNIFRDPAASGGMELAISNVGADGEVRLLRHFPLDGIPEPDQCAELVRDIETAAMDDASQLRGARQHYMLSASARRGHELGSLPLTYMPLNAGWNDGDGAQPTERGVLELVMKQLQAMHVLYLQTVGPMNEALSRRLVQQDATIDRLTARAAKFADEKEELATRRFERDLALETARKKQDLDALHDLAELQKSEKFQKVMHDKLGALLSIAANRLAGGKQAPGPTSQVDAMVGELAKHLTEEEVAGIGRAVRPELAALLREILSTGGSSAAPAPGPTLTTGATTATTAPSAPATGGQVPDLFGPLPAPTKWAAIEIVRRELLPWLASPLSTGKDIVAEKPMAIMVLTRLMQAMTVEEYEGLITNEPRLDPAERKTFAALIEKLELGPCGTPEVKKTT